MSVLFDSEGVTQDVLGMPPNSGELLLLKGNLIESTTQGAHAAVAGRLEEIYGF